VERGWVAKKGGEEVFKEKRNCLKRKEGHYPEKCVNRFWVGLEF